MAPAILKWNVRFVRRTFGYLKYAKIREETRTTRRQGEDSRERSSKKKLRPLETLLCFPRCFSNFPAPSTGPLCKLRCSRTLVNLSCVFPFPFVLLSANFPPRLSRGELAKGNGTEQATQSILDQPWIMHADLANGKRTVFALRYPSHGVVVKVACWKKNERRGEKGILRVRARPILRILFHVFSFLKARLLVYSIWIRFMGNVRRGSFFRWG